MKTKTSKSPLTAAEIRRRIERGGERLWRFEDFRDLPFAAVAKTLSRLARDGFLQRLSKGTYYRARKTSFGSSRPNPAAIQKLAARRQSLFPSGIAAANLLGFSTQTARRNELATCAASLPRKLVGNDTIVHTRRPASWSSLSEKDAALMDFLRHAGRTSELSPKDTVRRTLALLSDGDRYQRLLKIAVSEPPRARALLGALGESMGVDSKRLERLRATLNPLSKFDFGIFAGLPHARQWQARTGRA
jgi:hypothetical protein